MEIVIKIPEEIYKNKNYIDYFGCSSLTLADAIENGTPIPDNATNGDVIKAMFPNTELHKESDYVSLTIQDGVYLEDRDGSWWFTPHQKGGKE